MQLSRVGLALTFFGILFIYISAEDTKDLLAELNNVLNDIQVKSKKDVISTLLKSGRKETNEARSANHIENLGEHLDEIIRQYNLQDDESKNGANLQYNDRDDAESASKLLQKELDEIIARRNLNNNQKTIVKKEILIESDEEIKTAISELDKSKNENHIAEQEKEALKVLSAFAQAEQKRKREEEECKDDAGTAFCYKNRVLCKSEPQMMRAKCRRSCNFCCKDDTTFMQPGQCESYKKLGVCERDNDDRLRVFCPKMCGICGRASTEIPCVRSDYGCCWDGSIAQGHLGTPQDKCPPCTDLYPTLCQRFSTHCDESWGKAGEQVRRLCPRTCRKCGPHKICRDKLEVKASCVEMKANGLCNTFKIGMKYQCAKTCDLCKFTTVNCRKTIYGCCADGKSIAQGPYREGCQECTDMYGPNIKCEFWKNHNACEGNRDQMEKLCPGTCGFCKTK